MLKPYLQRDVGIVQLAVKAGPYADGGHALQVTWHNNSINIGAGIHLRTPWLERRHQGVSITKHKGNHTGVTACLFGKSIPLWGDRPAGW